MLKNKMLHSLNDGKVSFYKQKSTSVSTFGARVDQDDISKMEYIVTLDFKQRQVRSDDYEIADRFGWSLSRKIQCHDFRDVDSSCKAEIDGSIYDVATIDRDGRYMWVYLEGGEES